MPRKIPNIKSLTAMTPACIRAHLKMTMKSTIRSKATTQAYCVVEKTVMVNMSTRNLSTVRQMTGTAASGAMLDMKMMKKQSRLFSWENHSRPSGTSSQRLSLMRTKTMGPFRVPGLKFVAGPKTYSLNGASEEATEIDGGDFMDGRWFNE